MDFFHEFEFITPIKTIIIYFMYLGKWMLLKWKNPTNVFNLKIMKKSSRESALKLVQIINGLLASLSKKWYISVRLETLQISLYFWNKKHVHIFPPFLCYVAFFLFVDIFFFYPDLQKNSLPLILELLHYIKLYKETLILLVWQINGSLGDTYYNLYI